MVTACLVGKRPWALGSRLLANQREERRQLGPAWDEHGLVFPNTVGRPLHSSNFLQRNFSPLLERAGLPHIRFHVTVTMHREAVCAFEGLLAVKEGQPKIGTPAQGP